MDYLQQAEYRFDNAERWAGERPEWSRDNIQSAQAAALISIAQSLAKLADAVEKRLLDDMTEYWRDRQQKMEDYWIGTHGYTMTILRNLVEALPADLDGAAVEAAKAHVEPF